MSVQPLEALKQFLTRPSRRAIVAMIIAAVLFGPGFFDLARMAVKQHQLDRQLAALGERKERLAQQQKRLESDPGYVEGLIRTTFKMAQATEYVIPLASKSPPRLDKRLASE